MGVASLGCTALAAHTRAMLQRSCAESVADAVALAHLAHGHGRAQGLATHLGATLTSVVTVDAGAVQVTVSAPCGVATSTAALG